MTRRVLRVSLLLLVLLAVVLVVLPVLRLGLAYLNPVAILALLVVLTAVLSLVLASAVADSVAIPRWPFVQRLWLAALSPAVTAVVDSLGISCSPVVQRQLWVAGLSPAVFLAALVVVVLLLAGTGVAQTVSLLVFGAWTWWLFRSLRRRAVADRDLASALSRSVASVV